MTINNKQNSQKEKGKKEEKHDKAGVSEEGSTTRKKAKPKSAVSKCCSCFKYVILFLLLPPFLNYAALHQEQRFLQASETLYDMGNGQQISFKCEGNGKPTVLLEAPTGSSSDVWGVIIPMLSEITKVCTYDRAGLGFSDRPYKNISSEEPDDPAVYNKRQRWKSFTVESMVNDIYDLITYRSHQVDKPFIYVGSELGALVARFYTQIYETEVSDLVLVDPLVENIFEEDEGVWSEYWFDHIIPSYQTMQLSAATGLTRLGLMMGLMETPLADSNMQEEILQKQKHLLCHPRHLSSAVDEHHFINESFSQMQTVFMMRSFPSNVSVTIITVSSHDDRIPTSLNKAWARSQEHLVSRIHPTSHHISVDGTDRKILYKKPEAIVEPIKRLIRKRRQNYMKSQSS